MRVILKKWQPTITVILLNVSLITASSCYVMPRVTSDRAIGAMQEIRQAQRDFEFSHKRYGTLEELKALQFGIPSEFQDYYQFELTATRTSYTATAVPTRWKDRALSLYLDESGLIRGMLKNGARADQNDPVLRGPGINSSPSP